MIQIFKILFSIPSCKTVKKVIHDIPPLPLLLPSKFWFHTPKMHNNLEQRQFGVKVDNSKHNCSKN